MHHNLSAKIDQNISRYNELPISHDTSQTTVFYDQLLTK